MLRSAPFRSAVALLLATGGLAAAAPGQAAAQIVDFESTAGNYNFFTTAGPLTFDGWLSLDTRFGTGASSGTRFIFNRVPQGLITRTGGGVFSLLGGAFSRVTIGAVPPYTSGTNTGPASVVIVGRLAGLEVAFQTLALGPTPVVTNLSAGFAQVDEVFFRSAPGVVGFSPTVFIDDLNATVAVVGGPVSTVPEPASLALLGVGIAGLGAWRRRGRRTDGQG